MTWEEYWEVMEIELPNAEDYGYEGDYEDFRGTEGYWMWKVDSCDWLIRRYEAILAMEGTERDDDGYGGWVARNMPPSIRYEEERKEECLAKMAASAA